jgi:signal transduction histidine kinase/DNA-binding response OmpR family regulator
VERDECIGQKCYKAIRNQDKPCSICQFPKLLPYKDTLPTQFDDYLWDDILGMWTESKASIIRWVDDSLVFFHSINDRSVKKAYEDEMRKATDASIAASAAKTTFLANMSHEIRTPMNSIIGFAELAIDDNIAPKTKDYLGKIVENSTWLLQIIDGILDISKIESGKMELERTPFNLHSIITHCKSVIHPIVSEKGLDLRTYAEPPAGKKLLGDPVRLYQALMNLLSNAVKFTNSGTVELLSSIKAVNDDSMTICFEVKDNGIGMSSEQIERIFEPFMQADSSTTREYGGTGLGLPITKNIVELMGGKLSVESRLGAGSTFGFEITFETIDAPDNILEYNEINTIKKPHFDGLIMVCEDNQMNQQVIYEHLTRVGLQTVIAENGRIGVEMVQERMQKGQKPFDLILMDMFMPVMNGMEAASTINALHTGTPIVAMTANITTIELKNYKNSGILDYVGKPFTSQELWRCLLKYLTPVSVSVVDETEQKKDNDLSQKLKTLFVKSNQTKYDEFTAAVSAGDITLAHRLAHTLKTNAGLIGKTGLQNAAAEIEKLLKDGAIPTAAQMDSLETEINAVLAELKPLLDKVVLTGHENQDAGQVRALFAKLEPMLENINPECFDLLDEIRAVPGTEKLARQIEDYDFESAVRTLAEIKNNWV